jgi:hypothetical protein
MMAVGLGHGAGFSFTSTDDGMILSLLFDDFSLRGPDAGPVVRQFGFAGPAAGRQCTLHIRGFASDPATLTITDGQGGNAAAHALAGSDDGLLIDQPWTLHDGPGGTSLTLTLTAPAGSCGDRLATIDSLDISFNEGPTA